MVKSEKRPKVSVIMPVYNAAENLNEAVQSILNQTLVDFELIMIEDGSTDNSLNIIKKYEDKDNRIKVIIHKENKRIIQSLNDGLKVATGKYIARMDSDDISAPDRLERQFIYLEQHPETYLIGTGAYFINESGKRIRQFHPAIGTEINEAKIQEGKAPVHPSIMFRNEGKFWYRKNALHCDDLDLYLQMLSVGKKIDNITDPLLFYRFRTKSLTSTNYPRLVQVSKKIREIYKKDPKGYVKNIDNFDPIKYTDEQSKLVDYDEVNAKYKIQYFFSLNNYAEARKAIKEYKSKYKMSAKLWLLMLVLYFPSSFIEALRDLKQKFI